MIYHVIRCISFCATTSDSPQVEWDARFTRDIICVEIGLQESLGNISKVYPGSVRLCDTRM